MKIKEANKTKAKRKKGYKKANKRQFNTSIKKKKKCKGLNQPG